MGALLQDKLTNSPEINFNNISFSQERSKAMHFMQIQILEIINE